jgi:hypothetical protein
VQEGDMRGTFIKFIYLFLSLGLCRDYKGRRYNVVIANG